MRRALLLLVCVLMAVLAPSAASASVDSGAHPQTRVRGSEPHFAYCTYQLAPLTLRATSGTSAPTRRVASDPPLRWKGMWRFDVNGVEVYDARARLWAPELGSFLSVDEYAFHGRSTTLWGWPGQSPIRLADPSGHDGATSNPIQDLVDANLLPPGLTLFGKGQRLHASGIAMLANDATVEAGLAKMACGNAIMAAGMGVLSADVQVIAGIAQLAAGAASGLRGGSYRAVRAANKGGEVHHMPAWKAMERWKGNPFSYERAPGILMSKADHMLTESWGSGASAQAWTASTEQMLNEGRFLDALAHDIIDVQTKFPGKYDAEIAEMLRYLWGGNW